MAKILIYAGSCAKLNYSFIAPMRIVRACARHGDEVKMINWADKRIPSKVLKCGKEIFKWGECWTLSSNQMLMQLKKLVEEWRPDIVYSMGTTHINDLIAISKEYKIPLGLHVGDPFYASYPGGSSLTAFNKVNFITFNEGQAWNYIKTAYPHLADKCYLLNHAIDPELAPTWEEVQKINKKYICSCVGGDDRIRRRELILYFYQWTSKFSGTNFATGGSLVKGVLQPYTKKDLLSNVEQNGKNWNHTTFNKIEAKKFAEKLFNIIHIPNDLSYPLGLSHPAVHKLYSESYYGFTPFGYYLREGWQSAFNTMTFGTKIFEQMGSGCAIIANRIKDIEKIIIHGETGFILDTPEDAYKAFKFAIENPEKIRLMGLKAYQFAHKYHSWDVRYRDVLLPIFKKLGIKK